MASSLTASFDDLRRLYTYDSILKEDDETTSKAVTIVEQFKISRRKWWKQEKEYMKEIDAIGAEKKCVETELKKMKNTLKHLRYSYWKEIELKETLSKQLSACRQKLTVILETKKCDMKKELVKVIESLEPIQAICDTSNNSISDLDYDKSEDELADRECTVIPFKKHANTNSTIVKEEQVHTKRNIGEEMRKTLIATPSSVNIRQKLQPLNLTSNSEDAVNITMNNTCVMNESAMANRKHRLVKKLILKREQCNVCMDTIAMFSTVDRCGECCIVCHSRCAAKINEIPCITNVPKLKTKVGRLTLVADYTDLKAIPCVPPLIAHCCTEIEKRSINDNVYREIAKKAEVEKLINKILNSKSGMPSLQSENLVNVYGAVKHFLFTLDEPLITRVLWRDFARATDLDGERKEDM
ncbi:rac GTPase-activating protein 1-like isoform X4, partial [Leptotrombidium deliense]